MDFEHRFIEVLKLFTNNKIPPISYVEEFTDLDSSSHNLQDWVASNLSNDWMQACEVLDCCWQLAYNPIPEIRF